MWSLIIVVLDEFPVELESGVFLVVGSEPAFDLTLGCGFADSSEDMFDAVPLAVGIKPRLAFPYAPELAAVVGEDLSGLSVLMYCLVEEPDDVLCGSFIEEFRGGYEP